MNEDCTLVVAMVFYKTNDKFYFEMQNKINRHRFFWEEKLRTNVLVSNFSKTVFYNSLLFE